MSKYTFTWVAGGILILVALASCGASRSKCNTKNKTRTEMGWM